MSVKLIGRTTNLYGKTLWEILGNLRTTGVGRLVTRNSYDRYEEPSFFRVLSVEPTAQIEDKARKIIVHAEKIFRGKHYKEPVEIYSVSYKPDYRLIPKDEEQLWWDRLANCKPREKFVPGSIELPPLMKLVLERDNKDSNIKLQLKIRGGRDNVAKSDITKIASYGPSFFKNQQSS
ncbi:28S ribosomal protein S34, mitochondrial [Acyrthosiphon pisum]|uniref:ACYPI008030 protein n=1 Tax=Acyrthosiphon pisum TaxID=7029 RepID=C4WW60_ACYPI|nr:28S ribosomal protein S34, mitochondrial [Acyrthosiphon pisum]BAH72130.1 ACYPI008030 [Acyrthosiphon pisum]|eukprot:NP_001155738.1 28S ribosomal protein S34, mitochondrial [Acyrthosiphon pisum]